MDNNDVIVCSRVRLARNIANTPFSNNTSIEKAENILNKIFDALKGISNFTFYKCRDLQNTQLEEMLEDHLISSNLIDNSDISGVAISEDKAVSIMVNEEDHLREQCFLPGLNLKGAYDIISDIDSELSYSVDMAYDKQLGFLTSCPTNIGTGLRASVMMFLPGIVLTNNVQELLNSVSKYGICVRGTYGESSNLNGYLFQISNQFSLGKTEEEIIQLVESTALKIVDFELRARKALVDNNGDALKDDILRSYGVLSNCYKISSNEAIEKLSKVKLGVNLKLINLKDSMVIDDLINNVSMVKINKLSNKNMNSLERDIFRADYIGRVLRNNRI